MKTLRKIFYWFAGILAALVIISYLLPRTYKVERSVAINARPDIVYGLTSNFKLWKLWVPWTKAIDSTAVFEMRGEVACLGTSWKWNGKILGQGEMILTELIPEQLVGYKLSFDEGKYQSMGRIIIENKHDSVKVSWLDEGDLGYNPIGRFMGLFMERMMGPDFEKGLTKLKTVAEVRKDWPVIQEKIWQPQISLIIRDSAGPQTYGQVFGKAFGELYAYCMSSKINIKGSPFAIYQQWDSIAMKSKMDIGVPVEKADQGKGRIEIKTFPQLKVVQVKYFGPYSKTADSYRFLDQYIRETELQQDGGPWEIYVTNPATEKDTAKWETIIAFPVK